MTDSETSQTNTFAPGCCLAVSLPFGFFALSLIVVWIASALDIIEFNFLYALALQMVFLLVFTAIYAARGLSD